MGLVVQQSIRHTHTVLNGRFHQAQLDSLRLCTRFNHSFISIQPLGAWLAGTGAQSCERYGSGTLHPGQVLGDSLPLLSPAFRPSHFRRQVPVRPQRRERS